MLAANGAGHATFACFGSRRAQFLGRNVGRFVERAALKVARRQRPEPVECEQIGRRTEFAVLRRRRTERPLRQGPAQRRQFERVRPLGRCVPRTRDRLDILRAQHRPAAAPPGMAAIVRNSGVANQMLTRRPDRCDPIISAKPRFQCRFSLPARCASMFRRGFEPHGAAAARSIDNQHREFRRAADDDDGVAATALARNREAAAGKRVIDAPRQRALAHHGELRRRCQRASDQRAEGKNEGSLGSERFGGAAPSSNNSRTPSPLPPRNWRRTVSPAAHIRRCR